MRVTRKTARYEYDALSQLTEDAARRLSSVTAPSGTRIDYGYTHGYLTSLAFPGSAIEVTRRKCGMVKALAR